MLEDTSESAITVTSVPTTGSMSAQEEEHYGHYIEQEQVHLIRCGKYVESTITILIFISICICIIFTKFIHTVNQKVCKFANHLKLHLISFK